MGAWGRLPRLPGRRGKGVVSAKTRSAKPSAGAAEAAARPHWQLLASVACLSAVLGFGAGASCCWLLVARLGGPLVEEAVFRRDRFQEVLWQLRECQQSLGVNVSFGGLLEAGGYPRSLDFAADRRVTATSTESQEDLLKRCEKPHKPEFEWGEINYLPPMDMQNCMDIRISELLHQNAQVVYLSHLALPAGGELLLLVEQKGAIYQLNIMTEEDSSYQYFDTYRPYAERFKAPSCLNEDNLCEPVSATALDFGFLSVDQHRVQEFNLTWSSAVEPKVMATYGVFNTMYSKYPETRPYTQLNFPGVAAVYAPYNATHINQTVRISSLCPHASQRFIFVSDTGNKRVVVLGNPNATMSFSLPLYPGYENYFDTGEIAGLQSRGLRYLGQFGETLVPHDDSSGFVLPVGVAVYSPAWEYPFEPVIANVFVLDKDANRIVKLNFGYDNELEDGFSKLNRYPYPSPDHFPKLMYSGEYGPNAPYNESLDQPMGIALFRHYIFIAEARGNTIKVLTLDYKETNKFVFVTMLTPQPAFKMTGSITVSPNGYVWYTYQDDHTDWVLASTFLPESMRESTKKEMLFDFLEECLDYEALTAAIVDDAAYFRSEVDRLCTAALVNCRYPQDYGYIDPDDFNYSFAFNVELMNTTVFKGRLSLCQPPPLPMFDEEEPPPESPRLATAGRASGQSAPTGGAWWLLTIGFLMGAWSRPNACL